MLRAACSIHLNIHELNALTLKVAVQSLTPLIGVPDVWFEMLVKKQVFLTKNYLVVLLSSFMHLLGSVWNQTMTNSFHVITN
jgi:hypothetical protein